MKPPLWFECVRCGKRAYQSHEWELGDALCARLRRSGWTLSDGTDCLCPDCQRKETEHENQDHK